MHTIQDMYVKGVVSFFVFAGHFEISPAHITIDLLTYMTVVCGRLHGRSTENIIKFLLALYSRLIIN